MGNGVRYSETQLELIREQLEKEDSVSIGGLFGIRYDGSLQYAWEPDGFSKMNGSVHNITDGVNGFSEHEKAPYVSVVNAERVKELLRKGETEKETERRKFEIIITIEKSLMGFGSVRIDYSQLLTMLPSNLDLDELKKSQKLLEHFIADYTRKIEAEDYTYVPHVEGRFIVKDGNIDLRTRYAAYSDLREVANEQEKEEE